MDCNKIFLIQNMLLHVIGTYTKVIAVIQDNLIKLLTLRVILQFLILVVPIYFVVYALFACF